MAFPHHRHHVHLFFFRVPHCLIDYLYRTEVGSVLHRAFRDPDHVYVFGMKRYSAPCVPTTPRQYLSVSSLRTKNMFITPVPFLLAALRSNLPLSICEPWPALRPSVRERFTCKTACETLQQSYRHETFPIFTAACTLRAGTQSARRFVCQIVMS